MYKYLKGIRVTLSLLFFIAITFLFLDFTELVSSSVFQGITFLQFVPSAIKFIFTGVGLIAAGFLVIMLINLLFGRVYCSTVCPLGVFQDIVTFFSKRLRKKKFRFKYSKPYNILRYGILVLVVVFLVFGSITLLSLLDPYSVYGRFASDFFHPVYVLGNNLLAIILEKFNFYALYVSEIKKVNWLTLIIPAVFFIAVVWLAIKYGRLYCNTICPVGSFLGLLSKVSLFRLKIDNSSCTHCGLCSFSCKASCINVKTQEIDFSRCVACYNCISSCNSNSVKYKFAWVPFKKSSQATTDKSKRDFLLKSAIITAGAAGINDIVKAAANKTKKLKPYKKKFLVTPPGSKNVHHFAEKCTACHLCVSACPTGTLKPRFFESGISGLLQPFIDATASFCNFECTRCSEVCPTGAILPIAKEEKKLTQVGVVNFIIENCVVYTNNTACGSCSEHCPTQAVKMVPYKGKLTIPEVNQEICIGCGACEYACPVRPYRAIYVDGNEFHKLAKKPESKKLEDKAIEEFPF